MQPDSGPDTVRDVVIAMIVAHALDDLEAERVDLPTVLTLTALAGWREAERSAGRPVSPAGPAGPQPPRRTGPPLPEPRDEP
jgi:hypothetical protein